MRLCSILSILILFSLICATVWAIDEEPENMIQNPDFEAQFQSWLFWTKAEDALAERQIVSKKIEPIVGDNIAYVQIDAGGPGAANVQFYQAPFTLKKGKKYTFCAWAKSDEEPRAVTMTVIHHADPWTTYGSKSVTFTEEWNEYSVTFTQPVDDNNARIDFFLGISDVDVWIDHVRLYEGEYFNDGVRELPYQPVDSQGKLATTWGKMKAI